MKKILISLILLCGCNYDNYNRSDFMSYETGLLEYHSCGMKIWKMRDGTLLIRHNDTDKFGIRCTYEDWQNLNKKVNEIYKDKKCE